MIQLTDRLQEFLKRKIHTHYINGSYTQGTAGATIDIVNPANEKIISSISLGTKAEVDIAVNAASDAFRHDSPWRKMNPDTRAQVLYKLAELITAHSDSIAQLVTLENGKLLKDAKGSDVGGASKTFRYYAGWATKIEGQTLDLSQPQKGGQQNFAYTRREPVGVVAAIVPWNFPISIAAWKVAPALAAGCTVVLKPSEETPLSALLLAELATEAGIPDGVFNVVLGDGQTTGAALTNHPKVKKVTFTGSIATGKTIGKSALENLSLIHI